MPQSKGKTKKISNKFLFRDDDGNVKKPVDYLEGISFKENPLDFFILLARYKFAARLIDKNMHVLDAGSGLGLGSTFLSKFAKTVTAVDYDKMLLERNTTEYKDIKNLTFAETNLLKLPKKHKQYDAVVSLDVIEHFPKKDIPTVVQNLAKLTASNGFAVIGTPNIKSQPYASIRRKESHFHEFEADELKTLLKKSFKQVFLFSMTDENVSLSFPKLAWYFMTICIK